MKIWIALLRGVNVGGNNILPMKALTQAAEQAGFSNFRTYIQSGNCAFTSPAGKPEILADKLSSVIKDTFGFKPKTLVLSQSKLDMAIASNPYSVPESELNKVHLFFLLSPVEKLDTSQIERILAPSEQFTLTRNILYLHAPNGIGKSKLVGKLPQLLPVETTARNLRTINKISDLADSLPL